MDAPHAPRLEVQRQVGSAPRGALSVCPTASQGPALPATAHQQCGGLVMMHCELQDQVPWSLASVC